MRDINELFKALSRSAFRSKFHLQAKDLAYLQTKGLPTIIDHAGDFFGAIRSLSRNMPPLVVAGFAWRNGTGYRRIAS